MKLKFRLCSSSLKTMHEKAGYEITKTVKKKKKNVKWISVPSCYRKLKIASLGPVHARETWNYSLHENGAFPKRSSTRKNEKSQLCVLVWWENIFETGAFRKRQRLDNHVILQPLHLKLFSSYSAVTDYIVAFSNTLGVLRMENWSFFRLKTPFSNFSGVMLTYTILSNME